MYVNRFTCLNSHHEVREVFLGINTITCKMFASELKISSEVHPVIIM